MECEFASRERSGEEDAELQRSTKKVKEDQARGSQQVGREEGAGAHATLSYKASLVGDFPDRLSSFRRKKKRSHFSMKRSMTPLKDSWPSSCPNGQR